MIEAIKKVRARGEHSKYNIIRKWQRRGVLSIHHDEKGYIAYDTEEYDEHRKHVRMGRPCREGKDFKDYTVSDLLNCNSKSIEKYYPTILALSEKCNKVIDAVQRKGEIE